MTSLVINIGRQSHLCVYQINPRSRLEIQKRYPTVHGVPRICVGYDNKANFEAMHGPLWRQIASMLTGLPWEQIEALGGLSLFDPMADQVLKVA